MAIDFKGNFLITLDEVLKGVMRDILVRRTNARSGQEETETYHVRIPVGVQAGQSIRVPGKGGEGAGGGSSGDIYLRVRYAQHPDWQVRGADLVFALDLAPWEAVQGTPVPASTATSTPPFPSKCPPGLAKPKNAYGSNCQRNRPSTRGRQREQNEHRVSPHGEETNRRVTSL